MTRIFVVALFAAALLLNVSDASAQDEANFHQDGVSLSFPGWERFEPSADVEHAAVIAVRRVGPLRVCALERTQRPRADNTTQALLNTRLVQRAEAFAQTMRHGGTVDSWEVLTIDGVAVVDAHASGGVRPNPDRIHNRFFFLLNGQTVSSYRIECVVFGVESQIDRAAVEALMNSLHFDQDQQ
jgi:hypothetical protein